MKKIYLLIVAAVMCLALAVSCEKEIVNPDEKPDTEQSGDQNDEEKPGDEKPGDENPGQDDPGEENPDPENPDPENPEPEKPVVTWSVTASVDGVADGLVSWDAEDLLSAWSVSADGKYGYADYSELNVAASEASVSTAKFTFTNLPQGGKTWLAYMSNTGYDGCSAMKVEFNHSSAYTQPEAGVLPKEMVKLISTAVDVPVYEGNEDGTVELTAQMQFAGALLSYVVTSGSGIYADETVASVQIVSQNNYLASQASSSAFAYNMIADGKYWMDNSGSNFGDDCALIWENTSRSITTTVASPAAVSEGKAVYMPAPPVNVGGYKVIVYTDLAFYTFDFTSENLTLEDHAVNAFELDLEASNVKRIGHDEVRGDLLYEGGIPESINIPHDASTGGIGYWYARTKDKDSNDWVTREANVPENAPFYQSVTFTVTDDATGAEADWLTVAYRANDTWWDYTATANPSSEPRSATITATYADAGGYLIQDASRTKTTRIVQAAHTDLKTLGFYGGVGDQTISGTGVNAQSLGYCVITVDGTLAEDWSGNSHNEQALYANVEIVCREGSAEGPVVDWLTVEYGKDGSGKHNSTHLLATASANTGDAARKALVCCTYTAPEGYQFENGQSTAFRQFFVNQPSASADKELAFWGGLASDYTHDASAQTAWALSYWVITVDGTNATDWTNDSLNEQALYGAAEFRCYDYTDGVRGAEIDWITVDYKSEDGKYIDTWWLADIKANDTGAVRKAEVVCTFPEMKGYTYKDNQRVRSTIIIQNP